MRDSTWPTPSLGQPFLGPRSTFPVISLKLASGLHQRIIEGCDGPDVAAAVIGGIVYRHSCGDYGPISEEDMRLNDFLLAYRGERTDAHLVISLHVAGGVWLRATTNLQDGRTTVRAAEVNEVLQLRRSQQPISREDRLGGDR